MNFLLYNIYGDSMKKKVIICGVTLIGISLILFLYINISVNVNINRNNKVIDEVKEMFDRKVIAYEKNNFPSLEINKRDYKGTIYIPSLNIEIPIKSKCGIGITSACYSYEDNLTVITTNLKDSIPNYKKINIDDEIVVNDMMGNSYVFNIEDIKNEKNINNKDSEYNLKLIVKNYFELSYSVYLAK